MIWAPGFAQDFKIYTESPRLLLGPQRLRRLQRERERKSLRWEQFELLVKQALSPAVSAGGTSAAGAQASGPASTSLPEPGFALALYYQVSKDREAGAQAVRWALGDATDLRQLALVFDWCGTVLGEDESAALAARLEKALQTNTEPANVSEARSRVLAAMALADRSARVSEAALQRIVEGWWKTRIAPALRTGKSAVGRDELYPLFEILHAVQDNLKSDWRESAPAFFKHLPVYDLLSYYPASYPAEENEYRLPAGKIAQPDLERAALCRAAELAMVAYDPNSVENQYLQGWAMHDRFLLRSAFGAPYEFLWANPYQPGLSYYNLPLVFHDELFGRLFARSSWDDDAVWAGYFDGQLQSFEGGQPQVARRALEVGGTLIIPGREPLQMTVKRAATSVFVVGLQPLSEYEVRAEGSKMRRETADAGGILELDFEDGFRGSLRVRSAPAQ